MVQIGHKANIPILNNLDNDINNGSISAMIGVQLSDAKGIGIIPM